MYIYTRIDALSMYMYTSELEAAYLEYHPPSLKPNSGRSHTLLVLTLLRREGALSADGTTEPCREASVLPNF